MRVAVVLLIALAIFVVSVVGVAILRSRTPLPAVSLNQETKSEASTMPKAEQAVLPDSKVPKVRLVWPKADPVVEGKPNGALQSPDRESLKKGTVPEAPEMWLEFDGGVKVRLTGDAKRLIRKHWQIACAYYYAELVGKKDIESRRERYLRIVNSGAVFTSKLERVVLTTPTGRRVVTGSESVQILELLNTYARGLFSTDGKLSA